MVSIIIPTIHMEKGKRCIDAIYSILCNEDGPGWPDRIEILARVDNERIGCPKMVKRLTEQAKHDLVMFLGDDTIPQPGFLRYALEEMVKFPDGWGLVGLNDQFNGPELPTHWLGHKALLPYIGGEFFCTQYRHCYVDHELRMRAQEIGRYRWAENARIIHDHPMLRGERLDPDEYPGYIQDAYLHDMILFRRRQRNGWRS